MKTLILSLSFFLLFITSGCEDPAPFEYEEELFVEAVITVDEPIYNIRLMRSQPLYDSFDLSKSIIKDASVRIFSEGNTYDLVYRDSTFRDYIYPDTNIKVKPNTAYKLEIRLADGRTITGETITPQRMEWVRQIPDVIQYPNDLNQKDTSLKLEWKKITGTVFYLISIRALDTLGYGEYLNPATEEKNEKIKRPWENTSNDSPELARWAGVPNNETPVVWTTLKWYGKNRISIYSSDYNFLKWFVQYTRQAAVEPILSSVNGAAGVFGSVSKISQESFVLKEKK